MKRVIFTDAAEGELEAIGDYIAVDNPTRAATFIQELRDRCQPAGHAEAIPVVAAL